MAANYDRPKPIDPIWYRQSCYINIDCVCGRRVSYELGTFAAERGVSSNTAVYELADRLRCAGCGSKPAFVDVTRHRKWR